MLVVVVVVVVVAVAVVVDAAAVVVLFLFLFFSVFVFLTLLQPSLSKSLPDLCQYSSTKTILRRERQLPPATRKTLTTATSSVTPTPL